MRDSTKEVPVHLLALSVGVIVANIYYVQPLLAAMARTFSVSVSMIGLVAMLTQVGTAIGMLIFVPLGDSRDRRALLTLLLSGCCRGIVRRGNGSESDLDLDRKFCGGRLWRCRARHRAFCRAAGSRKQPRASAGNSFQRPVDRNSAGPDVQRRGCVFFRMAIGVL